MRRQVFGILDVWFSPSRSHKGLRIRNLAANDARALVEVLRAWRVGQVNASISR